MSNLRDGFREIVMGHSLVDDFGVMTDLIEESALWVDANGGREAMTEDEKALVSYLIERQIALAEREGRGPFTRPEA